MSSSKAWVTLATNDSYSLGALVLAHSLKAVKTAYKLAILITPGVTAPMKQQIEAVFDDVKTVDVLDSKDQAHLTLMSRPELGVTFTKLHCWTLTDYEKCVFLDADTLVLQNCDELFEREELSAAPDPGWPDCFNTGVFVYKPSQDTFNELLEFARTRGSFDGGDQGLLNMFFKDWAHTDISKHLSFTYNVVWSSTYSYLPALKQFGQNMKIVHFIASSKPWLQSFNTETRLVTATSGGAGLQTLLQLWWDLFCRHVHPKLSTEMIENRLSSRYSYDSHSDSPDNHTPNNTPNNSTFNNHYAPTCDERPNEDSYDFVDPWDEYLVASDQKENCETVEGEMCENRWTDDNCNKGDGSNAVEVCSSDVRCENDTETMNYSFRMNVIENRNGFGDEERNDKRFDEVREVVVPVRELGNENRPACSDDDIPINPNSSLSVNNCRPDSPTHCEVHTDMQTCISDGGLAGQFARISLNEKTADQKALEDFIRRQSWEQGNMDYLGKDSFSNIWAKINETLGTTGAEVKSAGADVVKTVSPPQVVHAEEPRPLKSALKKTSTSTPPVESELIDSSGEPPAVVKLELEKLDLSGDNLKGAETPETPAAVTSPAPPITPAAASRAQQSPKPESIGPGARGTECAKELGGSAETETECAAVAERPDGGAAIPSIEKDTAEPEVVTAAAAELEEGSLPGSESSASKSDEPVVKETCQEEPAATGGEETAQPRAVQSSAAAAAAAVVDSGSSTTRLDGSDDAPVAPKRTNKGNSSSNAPKNVVKPSEEK